jgi:Predicted membrane protein
MAAFITGTILGIIFGASSLYLVLKVGLTVSASIPVAVLSITIFRVASKFFGRATRQSCKTTSFKRQGRPASRSRSAWV